MLKYICNIYDKGEIDGNVTHLPYAKYDSGILDICRFFIILHSLCNNNFEGDKAIIDNHIQNYKLLILFKSLQQQDESTDEKKERNDNKICNKKSRPVLSF